MSSSLQLKSADAESKGQPVNGPIGPSTNLAVWGWISIAVYTAFLAYYSSNLVDKHFVNHRLSNFVTIPGVILLLIAYWRGFQTIKQNDDSSTRPIWIFGITAALVAVCIPNFHSSDLYTYIDCGWQQARYHLNPYITTVAETPGFGHDPMLTGVWSWNPCPYGFTFSHITNALCQLGNGDLALTVRLLRCLNLCAFLAGAVLVYVGAKRLKLARPDLSLYLYLWSPLILLQSLTNCHNDIFMPLLAMTGIFFATTTLLPLISPFLVLGASIKYLWLLSFPFVGLYLFRRAGWKALVLNVMTALVTLGCLAYPYVADWRQFRTSEMRQDFSFSGKSLPALIGNIGQGIEHVAFGKKVSWFEEKIVMAMDVTKVLLFAGFVVFSLLVFIRAVQEGKSYSLTAVIEDSVLLALLAVCLVSSKFYPWYLIMFVPAALWIPQGSEVRRLAIILSCTQLFAFTVIGHSGGINFVLLTALPLILSAPYLVQRANLPGRRIRKPS